MICGPCSPYRIAICAAAMLGQILMTVLRSMASGPAMSSWYWPLASRACRPCWCRARPRSGADRTSPARLAGPPARPRPARTARTGGARFHLLALHPLQGPEVRHRRPPGGRGTEGPGPEAASTPATSLPSRPLISAGTPVPSGETAPLPSSTTPSIGHPSSRPGQQLTMTSHNHARTSEKAGEERNTSSAHPSRPVAGPALPVRSGYSGGGQHLLRGRLYRLVAGGS